jgi:hypothetical protein
MTDKLPFLSDDFHYAITKVAAHGSVLDYMIELCLYHLLPDHENLVAYLLKHMSSNRYVGLVEALFKDAFPNEADAITAEIKAVEDARNERNRLMHWLWSKSEDPAIMKMAHVKPHREERETRFMALEEVRGLGKAILDAHDRLNERLARFQSERLEALRQTRDALAHLQHCLSALNPDEKEIHEQLARQQRTSQE